MTAAERMAAMRARNRQKGQTQITVKLSEKTVRMLDHIAKRDGLSRSELFEQLIKMAL